MGTGSGTRVQAGPIDPIVNPIAALISMLTATVVART